MFVFLLILHRNFDNPFRYSPNVPCFTASALNFSPFATPKTSQIGIYDNLTLATGSGLMLFRMSSAANCHFVLAAPKGFS